MTIITDHKVENVDHLEQSLLDEITCCCGVDRQRYQLVGQTRQLWLVQVALLEDEALVKKPDDCKARFEETEAAVPNE